MAPGGRGERVNWFCFDAKINQQLVPIALRAEE